MAAELAGILQAALGAAGQGAPASVAPLLDGVQSTAVQSAIAATLASGRRAIWLGALALRHSGFADLRALARELARITGASFGELREGANSAGAYIAGAVPHRSHAGGVRSAPGLDARKMLEQSLKAYLLVGTEPWADGLQPGALAALKGAKFVGAITSFVSEPLLQVAHVLLPAGTFAETSGTYVSLEGRWQSFTAAARAQGSSRPAWKILRVLGNLLDLAGFDYQSSEQVREELRAAFEAAPQVSYEGSYVARSGLAVEALRDVPMYQLDPVLRRAPALQQTRVAQAAAVEYAP
jgi:NADH-quinone oxidoreductase subunit G